MSTHAFIDESIRGGTYLICATTCASDDLIATRKALRGLLLRGQPRLHFASESDQRRRKILSQIGELASRSVIYSAKHRDQPVARAAILERATKDLQGLGVERLTIESREGQDHHDRSVIYRCLGPVPAMAYYHATAIADPMLWIPDSIAWAYGRGGDWKRRLNSFQLVSKVEQVSLS